MLAPGEESINGIFTLKGLFKLNGLSQIYENSEKGNRKIKRFL